MPLMGASPYYKRTYQEHDVIMREKKFQYDIPRLPAWVGVKVTFPFLGAAARVRFYDRNDPRNEVSSYLDVEDNLCSMEQPYFEIYPAKDGYTDRFFYSEQEQMYPEVIKSLKRQRRARAEDQ